MFFISDVRVGSTSTYALTANLRRGYFDRLRSSFFVTRPASRTLKAFRMARVFFGLKSRGMYFFPLYNLRRFSFVFWFMTMYTRAIALRTTRLKREFLSTNISWRQFKQTYILESFDGAPPVTLATRSPKSSCLRSSSCLVNSFLSF